MIRLQKGDSVRFYGIVRFLDEGQGAMSAVYEARLRAQYQTPEYPERVALKLALPEYEDRLRAEAEYLGRCSHTNIVKVLRVPKTHNPAYVGITKLDDRSTVCYMAMEFLAGGSLRRQLEQRGRLPLHEAATVARDVALGLHHAHCRQIINLDIKPDNILYRDQGRRWLGRLPGAVLCDFGIARDLNFPRFGVRMGTRSYAAPEQFLNQPDLLGFHSDVYQWAVVLYEMVTGQVPPNLEAGAPLVPASRVRLIPAELDQLLLRALKRDPAERYQSMDDVLIDVQGTHLVTIDLPGRSA